MISILTLYFRYPIFHTESFQKVPKPRLVSEALYLKIAMPHYFRLLFDPASEHFIIFGCNEAGLENQSTGLEAQLRIYVRTEYLYKAELKYRRRVHRLW
jgi:hypothetical protein